MSLQEKNHFQDTEKVTPPIPDERKIHEISMLLYYSFELSQGSETFQHQFLNIVAYLFPNVGFTDDEVELVSVECMKRFNKRVLGKKSSHTKNTSIETIATVSNQFVTSLQKKLNSHPEEVVMNFQDYCIDFLMNTLKRDHLYVYQGRPDSKFKTYIIEGKRTNNRFTDGALRWLRIYYRKMQRAESIQDPLYHNKLIINRTVATLTRLQKNSDKNWKNTRLDTLKSA